MSKKNMALVSFYSICIQIYIQKIIKKNYTLVKENFTNKMLELLYLIYFKVVEIWKKKITIKKYIWTNAN